MIYNYDGININITKQGSGEPVFLLHGWGCTGDIFKSINQVLSTAYTTYSFDFPGFGASDEPTTVWGVEEYTRMVEQFAKDNGIDNAVFVGAKEREEVKEELANADVFLFMTYFRGEGFSNALAEAMAAGLPCIVTDWAANRDMIGTEGGAVVGVKDVDAAEAALKSMLSPEVREKQSMANIKKVAECYVDSVVPNMYVDAYEEILSNG